MITLLLNIIGWLAFVSASLIWLWGKFRKRNEDIEGKRMSDDLSETLCLSLICFSLGIFTALLVVIAVVVYSGDGY
jgi:hypothetical protein